MTLDPIASFSAASQVECIIGFIEWERRIKQTVVIDIEMPVDCRRAAEHRRRGGHLDYKQVAKRIIAFVRGLASSSWWRRWRTASAMLVLEEFGIDWVRLSVNKPGAIRGSRDVGVCDRAHARRPAGLSRELSRMPRVFVAAGSNVEPERNLRAGRARAAAQRFPTSRFSPWYRNKAVGFEGEDFINFVGRLHARELPVHEVVARLREIETLCGRPRGAPKWAPRSMDLDILLYGDLVREEPGLKLPRPDLLKRPFMLGPTGGPRAGGRASDRGRDHRRAVAAIRSGRASDDARASRTGRELAYQPTLRPPSTARIWPVTIRRFGAEEQRGARHVFRRARRASAACDR